MGSRGKGENGKGGTGTLNVNLEALITSMILKAAQLMSYPSICNCGSGDGGTVIGEPHTTQSWTVDTRPTGCWEKLYHDSTSPPALLLSHSHGQGPQEVFWAPQAPTSLVSTSQTPSRWPHACLVEGETMRNRHEALGSSWKTRQRVPHSAVEIWAPSPGPHGSLVV